MILYIDKDSNQLITDPNFKSPVNNLSFIRGDSAKVEVRYVSGTTVLSATSGKLIQLGIKESGKYDADYLVSASDYTLSGTSYNLYPNFNTVALNDILNHDGDDSNDIASVNTMFQITTSDNGVDYYSTPVITAVIFNDVCKGDESIPLGSQSQLEWLGENIQQFIPSALSLSSAPIDGSSAVNRVNTLALTGTLASSASYDYTYLYYDGQINNPEVEFEITLPTPHTLTDLASAMQVQMNANSQFIANGMVVTRVNTTLTIVKPLTATSNNPPTNFWILDPGNGLTQQQGVRTTPYSAAVAGTSGTIGQMCYVNALTAYSCSQTSPVKWLQLN